MKYILSNPSFRKGPIEIDNPQAINKIEGHMKNPKLILGDEIILCVEHRPLRLQLVSKDNEKIEFKLVYRNKKGDK